MNFVEFLKESADQDFDNPKTVAKAKSFSKGKFKVRFHLGAGVNFLKWRVENLETKVVKYYDPKEVSLVIEKAYLSNSKATANKINSLESNKTVCSWIMANKVTVVPHGSVTPSILGTKVAFNPHVLPHWTKEAETDDEKKKAVAMPSKTTRGQDVKDSGVMVVDVDKSTYEKLITNERAIFIMKGDGDKLLKNDLDNAENKEEHI